MKKAFVVSGIVTTLAAFASQACTLGSDTYITSEPGISAASAKDAGAKSDAATSPSPSGGGSGCEGAAFITPDTSKLTACGDGKGHCYPKAKTAHAELYGPCPDASELCVPDEVLAAGGKPLQACNSVSNEGGCITKALIPALVADPRAAALTQDSCGEGQVCVPCLNPLDNNAPSGFCEPNGVHGECASGGGTAPAGDGGTTGSKPLPSCCGSGATSHGVCLPETAIPEDQRGDAPEDSCASGTLCAPRAFVEGKQVNCNSGLLGTGVCLDSCFNEMMGFASSIGILGKDRCEDSEVCVPCTFLSGKGVPGCK